MGAKRCLLVLIIIAFTFVFALTAHPATRDEIKSLQGLTGMYVLVENLSDQLKKELQFDENQIQVDAELKLRMAGIKILSLEESFRTHGTYLYVYLFGGSEPKTQTLYYVVRIELHQDVALERNSMHLSAPTWHSNTYAGIVSKFLSNSVIRDAIKDRLDEFINDYLSVNPKGGK